MNFFAIAYITNFSKLQADGLKVAEIKKKISVSIFNSNLIPYDQRLQRVSKHAFFFVFFLSQSTVCRDTRIALKGFARR